MKNMKKLFALLVAVVMVFAMTTVASAAATGSITVSNAAIGERYTIVKLFDATATGNADGSIYYTGTIPTELADYFETKNTNDEGNAVDPYIVAKKDLDLENSATIEAFKAWANDQDTGTTRVAEGNTVTFSGLDYGYYIVVSSMGAAVTIDSTNPDATVYDKNSNSPILTKTVDDANVYIGQTVTYTLTVKTVNVIGRGEDSEIVTKYVIKDTLPDWLDDVTVTDIKIDGNAQTVQQFDTDKKIEIGWADKGTDTYTSKYMNGVKIEITYTAKVTEKATVDGDGNKNTMEVTLESTPGDDSPDPWNERWETSTRIYTYAAMIKKVDENDTALAGATFAIKGLTVSGDNGLYVVTAYDETESATNGTTMKTDANGKLIIKGIPSDVTFKLTEMKAPDGYNKLTGPVNLNAQTINETVTTSSTTIYYDANGEETTTETDNSKTTIIYNTKLDKNPIKVVNHSGSELPSTGGIGTTIFYVVGGLLVVGAAIVLISKKRMSKEA